MTLPILFILILGTIIFFMVPQLAKFRATSGSRKRWNPAR
jgi:hypothetical protein